MPHPPKLLAAIEKVKRPRANGGNATHVLFTPASS
jgi:hypothetical protein